MRKTFKYRLNPTKVQRTKLNETLELSRLVYNKTLEVRKETYEQTGQTLSLYDTNKLLTGWKKWEPVLTNVYSQVLQNAQERVDLAFKAFFRRVKNGEAPGFPRFKSAHRYDSFTFKQAGFGFKEPENGLVRLSKIGDAKIILHRSIEGKVKNLTVRRDKVGNWYACFSCIVEPKPLPPVAAVIGIDVGLSSFATFSDSEKVPNPRFFKRDEDELKRAQRKFGEAAKGSPERKKRLKTLNHIEQRITNRRVDFAHKFSRNLVNKYQVIVFEKLDIVDMMDGNFRSMNRSIADVAWGRTVEFSAYKAEDAGRAILQVNPRGTTQECSGCHKVVPKGLSVRVHDCPYCGLVLDRDHNAALNILARGLAMLPEGYSASEPIRLSVEAPAL